MCHSRKNPRLTDFDYSTPGYYFVTVCTKHRAKILGRIIAGGDGTLQGGDGTPPLQDRAAVGGGFHAAPCGFHDTSYRCELTSIGKKIEETIQYINQHYVGIDIEYFVIMPNHIHLLIRLHPAVGGGFHAAPQNHHHAVGGGFHAAPHGDGTQGGDGTPPLHRVVGQLKSYTQRSYSGQLWQRSFHDHIIRNETDYTNIVEYIQQNPARWADDCHNPESDNFKEMRE